MSKPANEHLVFAALESALVLVGLIDGFLVNERATSHLSAGDVTSLRRQTRRMHRTISKARSTFIVKRRRA